MFQSCWRRLGLGSTGAHQPRRARGRKPAPRFRPALELLEDRTVLSTLHVTSLADSGTGTLRDTIAAAAPGDTIDFAVTGTIALTSGELAIAKDLTLAGPG